MGHGSSGGEFNFDASGRLAGTRVETKYCEGCGRMFVRELFPANGLQRDCEGCQKRRRDRQAKEARETQWARSLGQPQKKMPEVSDGVSRHRAGSESAVSPGAR